MVHAYWLEFKIEFWSNGGFGFPRIQSKNPYLGRNTETATARDVNQFLKNDQKNYRLCFVFMFF